MQITFDSLGAARQPLAWMLDLLPTATVAPTRPMPTLPATLRQGETLAVDHPQAQVLICTEGALWITHDHEPQDHIVGRGGRYVAGRPQRMLVHAMTDARVEFVAV